MSKRSVQLLLEDVLEAIQKIEEYVAGHDEASFKMDGKTVDATARNIEIIGEAVRHLPDAFKDAHPHLPWHKIAGMRNRIVHEYFALDVDLVWQITIHDLPELKAQIEQIRS